MAVQEAVVPGVLGSRFRRIPNPGGETPEDASTVYDRFYGSMPIPATAYATTESPLRSTEVQPSVRTVASNASVVQRANRRNGIISTGGRQMYETTTPPVYDPVDSSRFQEWLIGPHVNYVLNADLYIAYPAASVMLGGLRNQGLSQRIPQLPTRTSGGPGPATMLQAPRFKATQIVPRYSTMPPTYPTASAQG